MCTTHGGQLDPSVWFSLSFFLFFRFSFFFPFCRVGTSMDAAAHICTTNEEQSHHLCLYIFPFFLFSFFFFLFFPLKYAHLQMPLHTCALQTGKNPITSTSFYVFFPTCSHTHIFQCICTHFRNAFSPRVLSPFLKQNTHLQCHCAHLPYKRETILSPPFRFV